MGNYVDKSGNTESLYGIPTQLFVLRDDLKASRVSYRKSGIDTTSGGSATVALFKVDSGSTRKFYPTAVHFIAENINTHTSVAHISVGITGTAYTDVVADTTCTGLTATGAILSVPLTAARNGIAGDAVVYAKMNTNAVGTTETYSIIVEGFYDTLAGIPSLM